MAEDIVEHAKRIVIRRETISHDEYGARKAIGLLAESSDALSECIATIESLRAQLATSHALGFKAGIEAAAEAITAVTLPAPVDDDWPEDIVGALVKGVSLADEAVKAIAALPTPPSPLPEILEAMRPVAEIVSKDIGEDESNADLFRNMYAFNRAPLLTVGHLRAIAAVFTKLGGKIDAS